MKTIEKTITLLNGIAAGREDTSSGFDPRATLVVTLLYIIAVLSIPVYDPGRIAWFFLYPIIVAEWTGTGYGRVFLRSLWILPIVGVIGIFNPVMDTETLWHFGGINISRGWVSFISIVLRGLLAFQALIIFTDANGFRGMCRALQSIGLPKILVAQLWMLYRYIIVLLQEALTMQRARAARGYGKRHYPLKMWGLFVGQLLIRSMHRARRISQAMEARGFTGKMVFYHASPMLHVKDFVYIVVWCALFMILRHVDITSALGNLLIH